MKMKENNIIQDKSYAFAVKIVTVVRVVQNEQREFILTKQLIRSGTAIGALIEEAIGGQSGKDFFAKITIAYKEARETKYWLRLLRDSKLLEIKKAAALLNDTEELLRIIGAIQKTMRIKLNS
jgi:four helix bundle protein